METQEKKAVNWDVTRRDAALIQQIVRRAVRMAKEAGLKYTAMEVSMDITATHANGCKLRLDDLVVAPDFDFAHDVFGIRDHINRKTGQLEDCFLPRYCEPRRA